MSGLPCLWYLIFVNNVLGNCFSNTWDKLFNSITFLDGVLFLEEILFDEGKTPFVYEGLILDSFLSF